MKYLVLIPLLLSACCPRPWTTGEKVLAGLSTLAAGADAYTTKRGVCDHGQEEINPCIRSNPPLLISLGHIGSLWFVHEVPQFELMGMTFEVRQPFLAGKTMLNAGFAWHNWEEIRE